MGTGLLRLIGVLILFRRAGFLPLDIIPDPELESQALLQIVIFFGLVVAGILAAFIALRAIEKKYAKNPDNQGKPDQRDS
jgi:hypothetical protein